MTLVGDVGDASVGTNCRHRPVREQIVVILICGDMRFMLSIIKCIHTYNIASLYVATSVDSRARRGVFVAGSP